MEVDYLMEVKTPTNTEQLHIVRSGNGSQRFLIWHGFDSVNRFYPWDYLKQYGEVIRVGLPGHGPLKIRNGFHNRNWTVDGFIETAVAVCNQFTSTTPLTLIGHSAGALPALGAAIRIPEFVGQLILINPMVWSMYGKFARFVSKTPIWPLIGAAAIGSKLRRKQRSVDSCLAAMHSIVGDHESFYSIPRARVYIESGHQDYKGMSLRGLVGAAKVLMSYDFRSTMRATTCNVPSLIVHGDADPVSPIAQSEWLAKHLSQATLVRLPGVGHIGYGEREDEFMNLVTRWLLSR